MTTVTEVSETIYRNLRSLDPKVYKVEREKEGETITYTFYRHNMLMGRYQVLLRHEDGAICFGTTYSPSWSDDPELYRYWEQIVTIFVWEALEQRFGEHVHGSGWKGWVEQPAANGAAHAFVQTAGRCKYPDRLLAEVQAMLTRHLNTELLHSGRIETSGKVLGNEHRRHVISAEWRGLGRWPIGYIELYPTGDDWYSFELARYGTPLEVEDDQPAEDFFDGLIAQLESDYSRKAQAASGAGETESRNYEFENEARKLWKGEPVRFSAPLETFKTTLELLPSATVRFESFLVNGGGAAYTLHTGNSKARIAFVEAGAATDVTLTPHPPGSSIPTGQDEASLIEFVAAVIWRTLDRYNIKQSTSDPGEIQDPPDVRKNKDDVKRLSLEGLSINVIAHRVGISESTVKRYRKSLGIKKRKG